MVDKKLYINNTNRSSIRGNIISMCSVAYLDTVIIGLSCEVQTEKPRTSRSKSILGICITYLPTTLNFITLGDSCQQVSLFLDFKS